LTSSALLQRQPMALLLTPFASHTPALHAESITPPHNHT